MISDDDAFILITIAAVASKSVTALGLVEDDKRIHHMFGLCFGDGTLFLTHVSALFNDVTVIVLFRIYFYKVKGHG